MKDKQDNTWRILHVEDRMIKENISATLTCLDAEKTLN